MRKLLIGLAAAATVLGPLAASTAQAGAGASGARLNEGYSRFHDGDRGPRNWGGDSGGDSGQNVSRNRDWTDNNRAQLADRREDRWDRREDRRDAWHDGGRWDRREDRWDRRENRWDRRDDRRDYHWSSRDHWRRDVHNGYYYRDAWYFGPPPPRYYNDRYYRPGYRSWERGYRVPSYYRDDVIWNYRDYRLRRPPHGYHWVRADHDFLLVAIASGIIAEVILNDY